MWQPSSIILACGNLIISLAFLILIIMVTDIRVFPSSVVVSLPTAYTHAHTQNRKGKIL